MLSYMVKDVIQLRLLRRANSGLPGWALSQVTNILTRDTERTDAEKRGGHVTLEAGLGACRHSPGTLTATRRGSLPLEPLWGVELQAPRNVTRIHFCCFNMKLIQVQFSEGRAQSFHQTLKEVLMNPTRSKNFYCRGLSKILYEQRN